MKFGMKIECQNTLVPNFNLNKGELLTLTCKRCISLTDGSLICLNGGCVTLKMLVEEVYMRHIVVRNLGTVCFVVWIWYMEYESEISVSLLYEWNVYVDIQHIIRTTLLFF